MQFMKAHKLSPHLIRRTKLLKSHVEPLRYYSGGFSLEISHGLWSKQRIKKKFDWISNDDVSRYKERAKLIMDAIERQKPYNIGLTVYHGARNKTDADGWLQQLSELKVGDTVDTQNRFTSASLSFTRAIGFACTTKIGVNKKTVGVGKKKVPHYMIVRYDLPANHEKPMGIYIAGVSQHAHELEMIINPRIKWRVKSIENFTPQELKESKIKYDDWLINGQSPHLRIIRVGPA
jgi:hypothetical protein